jgi:hypothetical protein
VRLRSRDSPTNGAQDSPDGVASSRVGPENSLDFYTSTDGGVTWNDTMVPAAAGHYSAKLAPGV